MTKTLHIVLVGTSLLRNTVSLIERCASDDEESCSLLGLDKAQARDAVDTLHKADSSGCRQPVPGTPSDRECSRIFRSHEPVRRAIDVFLSKDPSRASAELNAMDEALGSGCQCIDEITLLSTDTEVGETAALTLKDYLARHCSVKVSVKRVPYLGVSFAPGLENLKREIVQVSQGRGGPVALNLTGGFKPEGAAAALIGYILPNVYLAYYKHESFRDTVVMPLTPSAVSGRILNCINYKRISCKEPACEDFATALCSVAPRKYECSCEGGCASPRVTSDLETALRMLV